MNFGGCRWSINLSALLTVFALVPVAARAETLTLDQALALAYETNPRLDAERAALRATDEDVATAVSGWRPTVSGSASYGYSRDRTSPPNYPVVAPNGHPRDGSVTITQPVFNPATIPQTHEAKAEVEAGRAQLSSVEQTTLLNAAKAYFDVLGDEAELNYKRHNAALLNDQLHMTQERVAIQDLARTDLELVQARVSSAEADVETAEAKLAGSRATFLQIIGRPAEELERSPKLPPVPGAENQAMAVALTTNPDLVAARYLVRQADAAVSVAYAALAPNLSVQLQYKDSVDEIAPGVRDSSLSAIAQLRVPLYQSGTEYAEIRRTDELRSKATLQAADAERQVRASLDSTWQTVVATRAATTLDGEQVKAAQAAYDGVTLGLRVGERTTFDLLNAEQDLDNAQVALVEAQRQYNESTFQLLAATGELTARALKLPVTLYDPQVHYDKDTGSWFGTGP